MLLLQWYIKGSDFLLIQTVTGELQSVFRQLAIKQNIFLIIILTCIHTLLDTEGFWMPQHMNLDQLSWDCARMWSSGKGTETYPCVDNCLVPPTAAHTCLQLWLGQLHFPWKTRACWCFREGRIKVSLPDNNWFWTNGCHPREAEGDDAFTTKPQRWCSCVKKENARRSHFQFTQSIPNGPRNPTWWLNEFHTRWCFRGNGDRHCTRADVWWRAVAISTFPAPPPRLSPTDQFLSNGSHICKDRLSPHNGAFSVLLSRLSQTFRRA